MIEYINNVLESNNILEKQLHISDFKKLQITKITDYCIYFKYNNTRYFIRENYECGDMWYSLYRKTNENKKWKVEFLNSSGWTITNLKSFIDLKNRYKTNIIYSHIDKAYFVEQLRKEHLIN